MASRTRQFFATPDEVATWLRHLVAASFDVLVHVGKEVRRWDRTDSELGEAWRVYVTPAADRARAPASGVASPGAMGWTVIDLHRPADGTLFIIQAGTKSDWYDPADGHVYENPEALSVFDAVWRTLRRHLRPGVEVRARDETSSKPARGLLASAGARAWVANGGTLGQVGARNAVFELATGASPKGART